MLYWEIIAVCSEIHIKHINTLCRQNVEFVNVTLVVYIVTNKVLNGQSTTTYRPNLLVHDLRLSSNYLKGTITEKVRYRIYDFCSQAPLHLGEWQPSRQVP
jgi:hypothetical protein